MMKLRQNWTVQELVETFQQVRPAIKKLVEATRNDDLGPPTKKRRIGDSEAESDESFEIDPPARRSSRRSGRRRKEEYGEEMVAQEDEAGMPLDSPS